MFKKFMESDIAKYVVSMLCMVIVFALTLSMGSSLASYTKTLNNVTSFNLLITSPEKEVILTDGYGVSNQIKEFCPDMTELYFGNWTDYRTSIAGGTSNTTMSFLNTVETMKNSGNAISVSGQTDSYAATAFKVGTKVYVVAPPNRTLYANPDSSALCGFGKPDVKNYSITKIVFSDNFDTSKVTNFDTCFNSLYSLTTLSGLEYWDTSNVTNMAQMFYYLPKITSLNLLNFDTSKVTNMHGMFVDLASMTTLDLSSFSNESLQYMGHFVAPTIKTVYISEKWTEKTLVVDYDGPAENADGTTNLEYYNAHAFSNENSVIVGGHSGVSFSDMKTVDPDNYQSYIYANAVWGYFTYKDSSVNESNFTLLSGPDMRTTLLCGNTGTVPGGLVISQIVVGTWYDYYGAIGATGTNQTYASFKAAEGLTWSTTTGTSKGYMDVNGKGTVKWFYRTDNNTIYILSCANNTMYFNSNCYNMFSLSNAETNDTNPTSISSCTTISLANISAKNVTTFERMFAEMRNLTRVSCKSWSASPFYNTPKLTNIRDMFRYCHKLTRVGATNDGTNGLVSMQTKNVTNMARVFYGCTSIVTIELNEWNTSKVTAIEGFLVSCTALTKVTVGANWNLSQLAGTIYDKDGNWSSNHYTIYNCPNLKGQNDAQGDTKTAFDYKTASYDRSDSLFCSATALAISHKDLFTLPEGSICGLDIDIEADELNHMPTDAAIPGIVANGEKNIPKNYTLDGFMLFENAKGGFKKLVTVDDLANGLNEFYAANPFDTLYVTPVYTLIEEEEPELPFELQDGYISGLDIGLEPMTVDAPLDDFGDLFTFLNWGEDNVPEGYLLDTFMFYTDYMYKEMYIEDAFDFLDAHYAEGADTVFNVIPVYMPDPDYEWPEPEEPVEDEPTDEGSAPEGDAPTTDEPVQGDEPTDTPTDSGSVDSGEATTPDEPTTEPPTDNGSSENGDVGATDAPSETPNEPSQDIPVETPDESTAETPDEPTPEVPVETPAETPTDSGSGDTGENDTGASSDAPADTGSSSDDTGSAATPADSGSSDESGGDAAPVALFNVSALFEPIKRFFLTLFGNTTTTI